MSTRFCIPFLLLVSFLFAAAQDEIIDLEKGRELRNSILSKEIGQYKDIYWLSDTYKSMILNLPRMTKSGEAAPKRLPNIQDLMDSMKDSSDTSAQDLVMPYAEGLALWVGVPLVLAILMLLIGVFFCAFRCCCGMCGGRKATRMYSKNEVWTLRILVLLVSGFLFAGGMVGYVANNGISHLLDDGTVATDNMVELIYKFVDLANETVSLGDGIMDTAESLHSTIFSVLPSKVELQDMRTCVQESFGITDQTVLSIALDGMVGNLTALSDITAFNAAVDPILTQFNLLKNSELSTEITALQASIGNVNFADTGDDLSTMDATFSSIDFTDATTKLGQFEIDRLTFSVSLKTNLASMDLLFDNIDAIDGSGTANFKSRVLTSPGDKATMLSDLTSLKSELDSIVALLPTITSEVTAMQASVSTLQSSAVTSTITAIDIKLQSIPALLSAIDSALLAVKNYQDSGGHDTTNLAAEFDLFENALNNIPSTEPIKVDAANRQMYIQLTIDSTDDFQDGVRELNASFIDLACLTDITDMIVDVNTTLVSVSDDLNEVLLMVVEVSAQLENPTQYHDAATQVVDALDDFKDVLMEAANLTSFALNLTEFDSFAENLNGTMFDPNIKNGLLTLNDTLFSFPDVDSLRTALSALSTAITSATFLQSMATQFGLLDPLLVTLASQLSSLQTEIADMGTSLGGAPAVVQQVHTEYSGGSDPLSAVTEPLASQISTVFDNIILHHSDTLTEQNSVQSVADNLASTPSGVDVGTELTIIGTGWTTFDAQQAPLVASLDSADDFDSSLIQSSVDDMKATLDELDMQSIKDLVNSISGDTDGIDLTVLQDQVGQLLSGFIPDDTQSMVLSGMDMLVDLYDQVEIVDELMAEGRDYVTQGEDQIADVYQYREDYEDKKTEYVDLAAGYEGYRLLAFHLIIGLPFIGSLFGVMGVIFKKGWCAGIMSCCFFFLIILFFLFVVLAMPMTVLVADQCVFYPTYIDEYLGNDTLSEVGGEDTPIISESSATLSDVVHYFLDCPDQELDIFGLIEDEKAELLRKVNASVIQDQIKDISSEANMELRPNVTDTLEELDGHFATADSIFVKVIATAKCESMTPAITGATDMLCVAVSRSLITLTFTIYVMALCCMCPGFCIGIVGMKRLSKQDPDDYDLDSDDDSDLDEMSLNLSKVPDHEIDLHRTKINPLFATTPSHKSHASNGSVEMAAKPFRFGEVSPVQSNDPPPGYDE